MDAKEISRMTFKEFLLELKKEGRMRGIPINIVVNQEPNTSFKQAVLDRGRHISGKIGDAYMWSLMGVPLDAFLRLRGFGKKIYQAISNAILDLELPWPKQIINLNDVKMEELPNSRQVPHLMAQHFNQSQPTQIPKQEKSRVRIITTAECKVERQHQRDVDLVVEEETAKGGRIKSVCTTAVGKSVDGPLIITTIHFEGYD